MTLVPVDLDPRWFPNGPKWALRELDGLARELEEAIWAVTNRQAAERFPSDLGAFNLFGAGHRWDMFQTHLEPVKELRGTLHGWARHEGHAGAWAKARNAAGEMERGSDASRQAWKRAVRAAGELFPAADAEYSRTAAFAAEWHADALEVIAAAAEPIPALNAEPIKVGKW